MPYPLKTYPVTMIVVAAPLKIRPKMTVAYAISRDQISVFHGLMLLSQIVSNSKRNAI